MEGEGGRERKGVHHLHAPYRSSGRPLIKRPFTPRCKYGHGTRGYHEVGAHVARGVALVGVVIHHQQVLSAREQDTRERA